MKKKILIAAGGVAVFLLIVVAVHYRTLSTRNTVQALVQEKRMINILIAGSNSYNRNMHRFFALVSVNPVNSNIGVTFLPPSYRVADDENEKGYSTIDRIDMNDFRKIRSSLKNDLKLNVPFYVELYPPDVKRIVDIIGGIDIFVLDQAKGMPNISEGVNYFDGRKIMRYINSGADASIISKYDRIQDILLTLYYNREAKKGYSTLKMIGELVRTIKTNILPKEIAVIAEILFRKGNLLTVEMPGVMKDGHFSVDDISYKIYEEDFLTPLIMGKTADSGIKIKILNGAGVPGLARKMRNDLIREGLSVIEFGTVSDREYRDSIIISRKGNISSMEKLVQLTGIRNIYPIIDNTLLHNVLIIIGRDMAR